MEECRTITTDARHIMIEFAEQTGISSTKTPPRRYLWTDAHAVCNFLSLYRQTKDQVYADLAHSLVDQVHNVLGRHRHDDPRSGWISGLADEEGKNHPTAGGLRIGKKLNERALDEPFDERLEWDRDGQYFHYLTQWMHALSRASTVTGESQFCRWAVELAKVAHARFTTALAAGAPKRLLWKMSIDLSYPLLPSTGLHDPLDAYITYNELSLCAEKHCRDVALPDLEMEIAETAAMIENRRWHTEDPLGLGGLLFDACRVLQLTAAGQLHDPSIAESLLHASAESLAYFAARSPLVNPAEFRLAFRELGLSIGLRAVTKLHNIVLSRPDLFAASLRNDIHELKKFVPLGAAIERFWLQDNNQEVVTWSDHLDINRVMLATSLLPDEFLIAAELPPA